MSNEKGKKSPSISFTCTDREKEVIEAVAEAQGRTVSKQVRWNFMRDSWPEIEKIYKQEVLGQKQTTLSPEEIGTPYNLQEEPDDPEETVDDLENIPV